MSDTMNFQSIILELQKFWGNQGCLIWQPYYTQVGAGTNNPATFLRVLGPEPWKVAYVEPSIRPDDGRYGDNPNRLQQHYQFQVILKPDPGNPVELYLNSLKAIGIDPKEHDIRFVEDNWTSPALGAWGLGWEVWLDGQEITQFTYFQQSGGFPLDPVSVEITYGLERIAIGLQRVKSFRDISWNDQRTYGEINLQGEVEHSTYYFEVADVERVRQMYDLFEAEANNSLAHGLVLPAHDNVLKCSHTFNILDARGAVGVTERQALFSRMRDLSRRVAEAYVNQRQSLGYPWLSETASNFAETALSESALVNPADFVLEIGTEELPVDDLTSAIDQIKTLAASMLTDLRLNYTDIRVLGTPRRLVLLVKELAALQTDQTSIVKGPPARAAFDAEGNPTKAAIGFARGRNIPIENLRSQMIDGGEYAVAEVFEKGLPTAQVLPQALVSLLDSIRFGKSMRWNSSQKSFSRPIRWLLSLHGDSIVPFQFAGLTANRCTRGLRFSQFETSSVNNPDQYFAFLESQGILLDPAIRKQTIHQQVAFLLDSIHGFTDFNDSLLDEVTNLVEQPTAILGSFSADYLQLPAEVLISVMKKHQRYFPVFDHSGKMMNYFITIRNGNTEHADVVIDGNEQVIKARFADATFFINEDRKKSLDAFLPDLEKLTFQLKLGSMLDKTHRIEALVDDLLPAFGFASSENEVVKRTASLCKADLATQMVIEMTSLQGIMGRYYAQLSGETEAVAASIFDHYLPRYTGDKVPSTKAGFIVGIADRVDSITGLFGADLAPSGTKDPFAQRRAAIGLVQSLIEWDFDLSLKQVIAFSAAKQPVECNDATQESVLEFIKGRLRNYLLECGLRYDAVDAVLASQGDNPASAYRNTKALEQWIARPDWNEILPAYSRCVRMTRELPQSHLIDPACFKVEAEKTLYTSIVEIQGKLTNNNSIDQFLAFFLTMVPAINAFFDAVLVMDEDQQVRENRLGLLQQVASLTQGCADLSYLEGF